MNQDYLDKTKPLKERKELYKQKMNIMLNPFDNFNVEDFEPLASPEEKEVIFRKRVVPPKELPTFGLKPKEIYEGQMIGMYESKQDLYLTFAHRCNELQKEIDELKLIIKDLTK